jgi:hypothetical protein
MEDDAPRQSIYISYASESEDDAEFVHRLFAALEEHGKLVTSFSSHAGLVDLTYREKLRGAKEEWREAARLAIKAGLNDDDLLQFFNEEFKNYPVGERLSDGAGKGLW